MTILLRLEKPGVELTVCGMISPTWLDGLVDGSIARGQGGLTQGQLAWRDTHRQRTEPEGSADDRAPDSGEPAAAASPPARRRTAPHARRRTTARISTQGQFDLVDTDEL